MTVLLASNANVITETKEVVEGIHSAKFVPPKFFQSSFFIALISAHSFSFAQFHDRLAKVSAQKKAMGVEVESNLFQVQETDLEKLSEEEKIKMKARLLLQQRYPSSLQNLENGSHLNILFLCSFWKKEWLP